MQKEDYYDRIGLSNRLYANRVYSNNPNSSLLVLCETSKTEKKRGFNKLELVEAFNEFSSRFGIPCEGIVEGIRKHGMFMTNGEYYFQHNSKLPFLQAFRSSRTQLMKVKDVYDSFSPCGITKSPANGSRTWFWTITMRTFPLNKLCVEAKEMRTRHGTRIKTDIGFEEIENADKHLKAFFKRLSRYGLNFDKYILVPEIKDSKTGLFNYHYHLIAQISVDIEKMKKSPFPDLTAGRIDGYVSLSRLSEIWKTITKDGSYRIKAEQIKSRQGCLNYVLSYLNKPMEARNSKLVPFMYYALKSKKAYRLKGFGKLPKIEYSICDLKNERINFNYGRMRFVDVEKITPRAQAHIIITRKNNEIVKKEIKITSFKTPKRLRLRKRDVWNDANALDLENYLSFIYHLRDVKNNEIAIVDKLGKNFVNGLRKRGFIKNSIKGVILVSDDIIEETNDDKILSESDYQGGLL